MLIYIELKLATEKTYKHAIFSIADPLVKNHIEQAIYACKFRLRFPAFYRFMVMNRQVLHSQLYLELEKAYLLNNVEITSENLEQEIESILEDRRFLDNAIGFIQTGKLLLPDLFLVSNGIMTFEEIRLLFSKVAYKFWYAVETQLYLDVEGSGKDKVLSYLNENGLYLPNLFSWLDVEDLFFNFLPIHLSYGSFNSSKNLKSLTKLPTLNECNEILKPLFVHPSPLYFGSSSYLDDSTGVNEKLASTHLGFQIGLDEPPENLPYILRSFLIAYQSRRLDFMREGGNNKYDAAQINEIDNLSAVANDVLSILDKFSNQRIGNRKDVYSLGYDAVLNSIIALFFIHDYCELIFKDRNLSLIDLEGVDRFVNEHCARSSNDDNPCGMTTGFGTNYESFINKLVDVLLKYEEFHVVVFPPNRGMRKIQAIQITLKVQASNCLQSSNKREAQTLTLNVSSLKKTIRVFLEKRIPEVEAYIQF